MRNSKVYDLFQELKQYGADPIVWDPLANPVEAKHEYGIDLMKLEEIEKIDAVIAAVKHREVLDIDLAVLSEKAGLGAPFIDVRSAFDPLILTRKSFRVWRL